LVANLNGLLIKLKVLCKCNIVFLMCGKNSAYWVTGLTQKGYKEYVRGLQERAFKSV